MASVTPDWEIKPAGMVDSVAFYNLYLCGDYITTGEYNALARYVKHNAYPSGTFTDSAGVSVQKVADIFNGPEYSTRDAL
jgi:hypothetical protein